MSVCRTGCVSKDHASYADCLRDANPTVAATVTSWMNSWYDKTKQDLRAYESARRNGIQPESTTVEKVRAAERATRLMGAPYNANVMPPASMVVNKKTAKIVKADAE